jgi:hypothetical protein
VSEGVDDRDTDGWVGMVLQSATVAVGPKRTAYELSSFIEDPVEITLGE